LKEGQLLKSVSFGQFFPFYFYSMDAQVAFKERNPDKNNFQILKHGEKMSVMFLIKNLKRYNCESDMPLNN